MLEPKAKGLAVLRLRDQLVSSGTRTVTASTPARGWFTTCSASVLVDQEPIRRAISVGVERRVFGYVPGSREKTAPS